MAFDSSNHETRVQISAWSISLLLIPILPGFFIADETKAEESSLKKTEEIPSSAYFDLKEVSADRYVLVGHLGLRRQFLGTRANPHFLDLPQFHSFNGQELKFSKIEDRELESSLVKRLADGRLLPVILTVRFESKRVGHDGINVSERLIAHIEKCETITAESACKAAEATGIETAESDRFKSELDPDFSANGIAISLGKVSARAKDTPGAAAMSIHGIRVFNTSSEPATIELTGATIEQNGVSHPCKISDRTRAPKQWQISAGEWADGHYVSGAMPGTLWMFDPDGQIEPDKEVKVHVKLKINGDPSVTLTRTVDPL